MSKSVLALLLILLTALACGAQRKPEGPIVDPIWQAEYHYDPNSFVYFNGLFFALSDRGEVTAFDETSGQIVWQVPADFFRLSRDADTIYALRGETCSALDPATGAARETFAPIPLHMCAWDRIDDTHLAFDEDDVYNGLARAYDLDNAASVVWETPLGLTASSIFTSPPASPPYVWRGHVIVYTKTFHEGDNNTDYLNFQVLDPATGEIIWELTDKPFGSARIAGDAVILTYADQRMVEPTEPTHPIPHPTGPFELVARDLATGEELWHVETRYAVSFYVVEDTFLTCDDGIWRRFDVSTGALLSETDAAVRSRSCPNSEHLEPNEFVAEDVWMVEGIRVTKNNPDFENPILDGWYTAYRISTDEVLWSTDVLIAERMSVLAMGREAVLTGQAGLLKAYALFP